MGLKHNGIYREFLIQYFFVCLCSYVLLFPFGFGVIDDPLRNKLEFPFRHGDALSCTLYLWKNLLLSRCTVEWYFRISKNCPVASVFLLLYRLVSRI